MADKKKDSKAKEKKLTCGIVMPISTMKYVDHTYTDEHWENVYDLIKDAAQDAGFAARMVSHADDTNIIQKTIVQNLYDDDVVVCDISAKNSNVMFEFGLRCAFDKSVVVIKDKNTGFSFDTSPFKHIEYSRDLGYKEIKRLQEKLAKTIRATYEESLKPGQSPFLKSFGEFIPKQLEKTEINQSDYIIQELQNLQSQVTSMGNTRAVRLGELSRDDLVPILDDKSEAHSFAFVSDDFIQDITPKTLAELLGTEVNSIVAALMRRNIFASPNQQLDFDTAAVIALERGITLVTGK